MGEFRYSKSIKKKNIGKLFENGTCLRGQMFLEHQIAPGASRVTTSHITVNTSISRKYREVSPPLTPPESAPISPPKSDTIQFTPNGNNVIIFKTNIYYLFFVVYGTLLMNTVEMLINSNNTNMFESILFVLVIGPGFNQI